MARAETYIGPIRGRVGNIIFRALPNGEVVISAAPRKTKKLPTRAQVRQRAKMLNALNFAKQNGNLLKIVNGFDVPSNEFIAWQHNTARPAWYRSILPTVYPPIIAPSVHALQVSQSGNTYDLSNPEMLAIKTVAEMGGSTIHTAVHINGNSGIIQTYSSSVASLQQLICYNQRWPAGTIINFVGRANYAREVIFAISDEDPNTWNPITGHKVEIIKRVANATTFNFWTQIPRDAYVLYDRLTHNFPTAQITIYQPSELLRSSSIVRVDTDLAVIDNEFQMVEPLQFEEVNTLPLTTDKDFIVITPEDGIYSTPFSRLNFSEVDDDIILDSWPQRRPQTNFLTPNRING